MGRFLQIRLTAGTFDPEESARRWPRLVALAWPVGRPGPRPEPGVVELAEALHEQYHFGEWDSGLKQDLGSAVEGVFAVRKTLEEALADWRPKDADKASYALEDALDELEKFAPKP